MPVVQVILFGFAIRTDVEHVRLAIVDPAPDCDDARAAQPLQRDRRRFDRRRRASATEARPVVPARRRAGGAWSSSPASPAALATGTAAQLLIVTDATEPNTRQLGAGIRASQRDPGLPSGELRLRRRRGRFASCRRSRTRFNPTRESSNLFVPGLMAFVLTIISSLMTAISLTREKETGTLEALLVSPLRPWQIIVGKVAALSASSASSSVLACHRRGAPGLPRAAARQRRRCCSPRALLFILVSLSLGILDLGAHLVAARGDDGRAGRHDAADPAAVRDSSFRSRACRGRCGRSRTSCRRAGS